MCTRLRLLVGVLVTGYTIEPTAHCAFARRLLGLQAVAIVESNVLT
jgi:hypothetical protein